jgi:hypothetical protein
MDLRNVTNGVEQDTPRLAGDRRRGLERAHPVAQRAVPAAAVARWAIHFDQSHAFSIAQQSESFASTPHKI